MIFSKKIKKVLNRCSRCGLCQSVCLAYKKSGNECESLKGKANMLNGLINMEITEENQIKNYLIECKNCKNMNECEKICPSEIKISEILKIFEL